MRGMASPSHVEVGGGNLNAPIHVLGVQAGEEEARQPRSVRHLHSSLGSPQTHAGQNYLLMRATPRQEPPTSQGRRRTRIEPVEAYAPGKGAVPLHTSVGERQTNHEKDLDLVNTLLGNGRLILPELDAASQVKGGSDLTRHLADKTFEHRRGRSAELEYELIDDMLVIIAIAGAQVAPSDMMKVDTSEPELVQVRLCCRHNSRAWEGRLRRATGASLLGDGLAWLRAGVESTCFLSSSWHLALFLDLHAVPGEFCSAAGSHCVEARSA